MVSTRRSSRLRRSTPQPPGSFEPDSSVGVAERIAPKLVAVREDDAPKQVTAVQEPVRAAVSPPAHKNPFSSLLSTLTSRTPKHKTPILPTHAEMHPSQHQQSTTKPLDEARWLGIMPMTEPPKKTCFDTGHDENTNTVAVAQATPTRATQTTKTDRFFSPPENLSFKSKASFDAELSPEARRIMAETREEAAKIRARMVAAKDRQDAQDQLAEEQPIFGLTNTIGARKIAKPRGRFSDAHKKQFGKMGSIADHPSAFRADPNRPTLLPLNDQPSKSLKRTRSKSELQTPPKSNAPVKNTFTPIPAREPFAIGSSKRVKLTAEANTAEHKLGMIKDGLHSAKASDVPSIAAVTSVTTRIPLPPTSITTPTKASLARSQSAKSLRTKTSIPTLTKSPSLKKLSSKVSTINLADAGAAATDAALAEPAVSHAPTKSPSIRSILRAKPTRLYSDDPAKVAAGTHLPTPTRKSLLPKAFATAPVTKHVDFTESTKERDDSDGSLDSPLTVKIPKSLCGITSETDASVAYPSLSNDTTVEKPAVSDGPAVASKPRPIATPKARLRRQTAGAALSRSTPSGDFTFRIGNAPSFAAPTAASTIRQVRDSSTPPPMVGSETVTVSKKRKLDAVEEPAEGSDKENSDSRTDGNQGRSAKKARVAITGAVTPRKVIHTPGKRMLAGKSITPAKSPAKKGGLTLARLNLLATPKHKRG